MESSPFTEVPNGDGFGDGWQELQAASPPALPAANDAAPGASAAANLPAPPVAAAPAPAEDTAAAIGTIFPHPQSIQLAQPLPPAQLIPARFAPLGPTLPQFHFSEPLRGPGRTSMMGQHLQPAPRLTPIPRDSFLGDRLFPFLPVKKID